MECVHQAYRNALERMCNNYYRFVSDGKSIATHEELKKIIVEVYGLCDDWTEYTRNFNLDD